MSAIDEGRMHAQALARVVACLVLTASAGAAPKIVGDTEVKPGGFALLTIEGAGKTVLWDVYPEPIQYAEISGVVVFTGHPGTRYLAVATVIDFKAESAAKIRHWVVFSGNGPIPPPVPPGPGPAPVPPSPADPLVSALREAAAKDGFPQIRLADLSEGMKAVSRAIDVRNTGGDIKRAATTLLANSIGGQVKAPSLLAVLSKEVAPLDAIFPTDDTQATPERKQAAKAIFERLAAACLEAAR